MSDRTTTRNALAYTAALASLALIGRGLWLAANAADVVSLAGAMSPIIGLLLGAYVGRVVTEKFGGKNGTA